MELALGDRAVAEEARRDRLAPLHLVGQREADRERQAAADDGVAAVEARGDVEEVHRAAAAAAAALALPNISAMIARGGMPRASAWPCSR